MRPHLQGSWSARALAILTAAGVGAACATEDERPRGWQPAVRLTDGTDLWAVQAAAGDNGDLFLVAGNLVLRWDHTTAEWSSSYQLPDGFGTQLVVDDQGNARVLRLRLDGELSSVTFTAASGWPAGWGAPTVVAASVTRFAMAGSRDGHLAVAWVADNALFVRRFEPHLEWLPSDQLATSAYAIVPHVAIGGVGSTRHAQVAWTEHEWITTTCAHLVTRGTYSRSLTYHPGTDDGEWLDSGSPSADVESPLALHLSGLAMDDAGRATALVELWRSHPVAMIGGTVVGYDGGWARLSEFVDAYPNTLGFAHSDAGHLFLSWSECADVACTVHVRHRSPTEWGADQVLPGGTAPMTLVASEDRALGVWRQFDNTQGLTWVVGATIAGDAGSPPATLSDFPLSDGLAMAYRRGQAGVAAWSATDDGLYAALYYDEPCDAACRRDARAPLPRHAVAPSQSPPRPRANDALLPCKQ
jgi:hypothetical protein